jgi:hypothetical protein
MVAIQRRADEHIRDLWNEVADLKNTRSINDPDWLPLTLQNSWVVYDSTFNQPRYIRLGRVVYVQGLIKNGTTTVGTALASLPAGYRPGHNYIFTTLANNTLVRLDVQPGGSIALGMAAPSNLFLSLDTIIFPVDRTV